MRHRSAPLPSPIRSFPVVGCDGEVTLTMLAADDALGAEFRQDQADRRPAGAQLLGELALGRQSPTRPQIAGRDQVTDRALYMLCLSAHTTLAVRGSRCVASLGPQARHARDRCTARKLTQP